MEQKVDLPVRHWGYDGRDYVRVGSSLAWVSDRRGHTVEVVYKGAKVDLSVSGFSDANWEAPSNRVVVEPGMSFMNTMTGEAKRVQAVALMEVRDGVGEPWYGLCNSDESSKRPDSSLYWVSERELWRMIGRDADELREWRASKAKAKSLKPEGDFFAAQRSESKMAATAIPQERIEVGASITILGGSYKGCPAEVVNRMAGSEGPLWLARMKDGRTVTLPSRWVGRGA